MDSPPLDNQTEFEVHPQLLLDVEGERLAIFIKATFELDLKTSTVKLAEEEKVRAIRHADIPWEDPEVDSIRYPTDVSPEKPGTDVIVVGTAWAPGGQAVGSFDAYARVGSVAKAVRVFGLRVWESGGAGISAPRPVDRLDLRYDFAWGGRDTSDPSRIAEEPRNPVGRGIAGHSSQLTHQLAPQIEDPDALIRNARTRPAPAGLGAIGRSFSPRREAAGTFDENWQELRCPLPPRDQRPEFHQCATPGLIATPHLRGGEACGLLNLHPSGALQFALPTVSLGVRVDVEGRAPFEFTPQLNTVLIDTSMGSEPPLIEMLWMGSTPAPRKLAASLTTVFERMSR